MPNDENAQKYGGKSVKAVDHPGTTPKPFMRPAMDIKATAALQAFADGIRKRLTKQGLDTPDVEVDVGEDD